MSGTGHRAGRSGSPPGRGGTNGPGTPVAPDASFREGVVAMLPRLRACARGLAAGDSSLADDVVQDTVLLALRAEARFTPGTNLEAWLLTILRNRFLSTVGHRRRRQVAPAARDRRGPARARRRDRQPGGAVMGDDRQDRVRERAHATREREGRPEGGADRHRARAGAHHPPPRVSPGARCGPCRSGRPGRRGGAPGRPVPRGLLSSGAALAGVAAAAVAWVRLRRTPAETPEPRRAGLTVLRPRAGPHAIFARAATGRAPPGRPPVVLVHGLVISSRYMVPLARALAPDFPVYAPDLPGFGESGGPPPTPPRPGAGAG